MRNRKLAGVLAFLAALLFFVPLAHADLTPPSPEIDLRDLDVTANADITTSMVTVYRPAAIRISFAAEDATTLSIVEDGGSGTTEYAIPLNNVKDITATGGWTGVWEVPKDGRYTFQVSDNTTLRHLVVSEIQGQEMRLPPLWPLWGGAMLLLFLAGRALAPPDPARRGQPYRQTRRRARQLAAVGAAVALLGCTQTPYTTPPSDPHYYVNGVWHSHGDGRVDLVSCRGCAEIFAGLATEGEVVTFTEGRLKQLGQGVVAYVDSRVSALEGVGK